MYKDSELITAALKCLFLYQENKTIENLFTDGGIGLIYFNDFRKIFQKDLKLEKHGFTEDYLKHIF